MSHITAWLDNSCTYSKASIGMCNGVIIPTTLCTFWPSHPYLHPSISLIFILVSDIPLQRNSSIMMFSLTLNLNFNGAVSGVPRGVLRVLEHPISSGTTASSVAQ